MALKSHLAVLALVTPALGWNAQHRVQCETQVQCNGNLCADTCVSGTVITDPWTDGALAYQRKIQAPEVIAKALLPGTHNAAISEAYGYGIEKFVISALNGEDPASNNDSDDIGEGVCQHLSLLDQLRMGVRHLEIDVWWTPATVPVNGSAGGKWRDHHLGWGGDLCLELFDRGVMFALILLISFVRPLIHPK